MKVPRVANPTSFRVNGGDGHIAPFPFEAKRERERERERGDGRDDHPIFGGKEHAEEGVSHFSWNMREE